MYLVVHVYICTTRYMYIYIIIYIYIFMSSCMGGSKAPLGTISAIYTRYAGTISTSYKNLW